MFLSQITQARVGGAVPPCLRRVVGAGQKQLGITSNWQLLLAWACLYFSLTAHADYPSKPTSTSANKIIYSVLRTGVVYGIHVLVRIKLVRWSCITEVTEPHLTTMAQMVIEGKILQPVRPTSRVPLAPVCVMALPDQGRPQIVLTFSRFQLLLLTPP
jgi:hypothetical protein